MGETPGGSETAPAGRRFHFISGLPRSGSTLTAAILRQNPRFHAGMSSPVGGLFEGIIAQVSAGTEMASPFAHDFAAVEYDAPEFDAGLGLDGLHRVHREVRPRPRATILPPDLFRKYSNLAFWRDLSDSRAFRIVEQAAPGETPAKPSPAAPNPSAAAEEERARGRAAERLHVSGSLHRERGHAQRRLRDIGRASVCRVLDAAG